jgi:hypothetical protein
MSNVCEHGSLKRSCEICERDSEIEMLSKTIKIFRDALKSIAGSHYQQYGHAGSGMYGIGVSDGHRYCADVASKALDAEIKT